MLLNFSNPLLVSHGIAPDQLIIKIRDKQMFRSTISNQTLLNENYWTYYNLPMQLPNGLSEVEV